MTGRKTEPTRYAWQKPARTFAYDFQTYILNHDDSMYNEVWNASGEKYQEINLCAEYLDRTIFELAATLLHEMTHLYNLMHDIQDVSNNGYYYNMKFKATAYILKSTRNTAGW